MPSVHAADAIASEAIVLIDALCTCRAEEVLPAGAARKAIRAAVKRLHNASQANIKQEEQILSRFSGRPNTVGFHGLFWDAETSASAAIDVPKAHANLVMGENCDAVLFC